MKARAGCENWHLDGDIITVAIPMAWKRRGGRKVIIAPDERAEENHLQIPAPHASITTIHHSLKFEQA